MRNNNFIASSNSDRNYFIASSVLKSKVLKWASTTDYNNGYDNTYYYKDYDDNGRTWLLWDINRMKRVLMNNKASWRSSFDETKWKPWWWGYEKDVNISRYNVSLFYFFIIGPCEAHCTNIYVLLALK